MAKTGRKTKPLALKVLNGRHEGVDSGGRPIAQYDAGFERGAPSMPSWLTGEARNTWRRLCPRLTKLGILKPEDRDAFAAYCIAVQNLKKATQLIEEEGLVTETAAGNPKTNPAVSLQAQAMNTIRQFASEFGLTPASESNVAVVGEAKKKDNDADNPFA